MLIRKIKYTFVALCCILCASCSWVKDDRSDCPTGVWLQLDYTYNILDVDAAEKQMDEVTVFVYDTLGNNVRQMQVSHQELLQNNYRVEIKDLPQGIYSFMVWSGLADSHYMISGAQQMEEFRLTLHTTTDRTSADNPTDLFFGRIDDIQIDNNYAVHLVSMHKDTNRLACIVESGDKDKTIDTNVYKMELVADNACLDGYNDIVSNASVCYLPYVTRDSVIIDEEFGERPVAEFTFATMRLLENDNARLILKLKDTDYEVFNIPLTQYVAQIASLYEINGRQLTPQEYIDRQDLFTFVFCLSPDNNALIRCKVNNWILRSSENIKF